MSRDLFTAMLMEGGGGNSPNILSASRSSDNRVKTDSGQSRSSDSACFLQ